MKRYYKYFALFIAALATLTSCEDDAITDNTQKQVRLSAPTALQANFNATPVDGEIMLSWGGAEGAESYTVALYKGNVDINSIKPTVGENNCIDIQQTTEPTLSYTELSTSVTTYYAYVQATSTDTKNYINSSWTTVYFSPKYNAPVIPQATFVSNVSGQKITIQWTIDDSVTPTAIIALVDGVEVLNQNLSADDVENAEFTFEGLNPYTEYEFELVGDDSYGKTKAFTFPIYEVTAIMESETNQNMTVTWNADAYPEFAATTITYGPYNQDQEGELALEAEIATAGTATVSDLKYGDMKYTFTIYIDGVEAGVVDGTTGVTVQSDAIAVANTEDLASLIASAESGSIFELATGIYANTTGEIMVDKNITLRAADGASPILENVYFSVTDATFTLDGITCQGTTDVSTFMTIAGTTASLSLKNSTFNNLTLAKRFIAFTAETIKEFILDNCIVSNITAPDEIMDFKAVEILSITNSTLSECNAGSNYLIDINGNAGNVTFDSNTFVNQTNRGIRARNKAYASFTFTNNIYVDFNAGGNRILYSTTDDAPSTSSNNFAYGYDSNRIAKEGMLALDAAPFADAPDANGFYKITDGTNAGDPDGL